MSQTPKRVVIEMPVVMVDTGPDKEVGKIPIAAYARVSTDKEEQEDSFERQVEHYTNLIKNNPNWRFVEVYADPGLSGTKAEKRPNFMRMIEDCRQGKIKRIFVKSVSRFARNTVDALNYIRELKDLGVGITFESENIDTLTQGGEVMLTILAAIAEEESRSISKNIKWAMQRKFKQGDVTINTGLMLGYKKVGKDENGNAVYEIVEGEADIVRRIFREYISGMSVTAICRGLEKDGIKTKIGKTHWTAGAVSRMLNNEKYTGNAILGKTYKPDVMSKKRYINNGEAPKYYIQNSHPAIIEKAMFDIVQEIKKNRKKPTGIQVGNTKYASRYCFSGLLICGKCYSRMRRHARQYSSGEKVASWACPTLIKEGREKCDSHHIREDLLNKTFNAALEEISGTIDEIVTNVEKSIDVDKEMKIKEDIKENENEILEVQKEMMMVHKTYSKRKITAEQYSMRQEECSNKLAEIQKEHEKLIAEAARLEEMRVRLETIKTVCKTDGIIAADDSIVKAITEYIVVYDKSMEIHLKCGAVIKKEYVG